MQDQQDYDRIASLIPNDQVANQFGTVQGNEKYMLGLHAARTAVAPASRSGITLTAARPTWISLLATARTA